MRAFTRRLATYKFEAGPLPGTAKEMILWLLKSVPRLLTISENCDSPKTEKKDGQILREQLKVAKCL